MIIDKGCFSVCHVLVEGTTASYEQTIRKIAAERHFCIAVCPVSQHGSPLAYQVC
ncbi:hypothetical protein WH47_04966 [Habropoda laboriosa]|uniref:Uncharacterized protein n=1 Tax=Habropoda laboriosa TaxID=597456 RepID=A0A0L7RJD2_9HYME|nr:hypothetical protein WH47_04966 [Habropoda laboriosa]